MIIREFRIGRLFGWVALHTIVCTMVMAKALWNGLKSRSLGLGGSFLFAIGQT